MHRGAPEGAPGGDGFRSAIAKRHVRISIRVVGVSTTPQQQQKLHPPPPGRVPLSQVPHRRFGLLGRLGHCGRRGDVRGEIGGGGCALCRTLHRAPVGQGPSGHDWLATAFGFWSERALATGMAWRVYV